MINDISLSDNMACASNKCNFLVSLVMNQMFYWGKGINFKVVNEPELLLKSSSQKFSQICCTN
jgi:hypothetical protein